MVAVAALPMARRWELFKCGGGERDVPGRMDSKWISYRLLSGLTSVPNPVRPRHVGDRSRVLRTRDLRAFIFAIKALSAMRGASPPTRCARRSSEINAHPGIGSLQSAHQRQTTG